MSKFQPGNKGRPRGSKNKNVVRSRLSDYVGSKWSNFEEQMDTLTGKSYVENFIRLLPFVMPSFSSIQLSLSNLSEQDLEFLISHLKNQMSSNESESD